MSPYALALRAAILVAALLATRAGADVVTDWNAVAIQATPYPTSAILQSRILAITHAAMFDAIAAMDPVGATYAVSVKAPPGASREAAAASAAHGVLTRLVPGARDLLDRTWKASLGSIPDGPGKTDGINVGSEVAERLVALRRGDGSDATVAMKYSAGPGRWQPTPPMNLPGMLPHWGAVKPFVLRSARQFEAKGPPAMGSPEFARDFDEVKSLGARMSRTRTADQTAAAIFWAIQTAIPWNAAARAAAEAHHGSLAENARLFAVLNLACADSQIVGFEIKYRLQHWRPITAIRNAAAASAKLVGDPQWEPLLGTPPHPDYPSTHALYSGAAEAVLKGFYGSDSVALSVTSPPVFGVTRTWNSFSQMAKEVDDARVWGGIHFRTADVDAHDLGRRIGEYALKNFPKPTNTD